jgi:hypothetical protein
MKGGAKLQESLERESFEHCESPCYVIWGWNSKGVISPDFKKCWNKHRGFKSSWQLAKIVACDPPNCRVLKKNNFFKNLLPRFLGAWWIFRDLGLVIKQFTRKNPAFLVCRMSGLRGHGGSHFDLKVNKLKVIECVCGVFMISAWRSQLHDRAKQLLGISRIIIFLR